jgi:ATP-dependent Clp protease ATP-binding subunit ClpC
MKWFKTFWQGLKQSTPSEQIQGDPHSNFTPRAQRVLELARHEATRLNHGFVGTEHLLLGILQLGQGVASNVLRQAGFDPDELRSIIEKAIAPGVGAHENATATLLPTPRVRTALSLAQKEAKVLNHTFVGTEHLLLGLLREDNGVAARVLKDGGADLATFRKLVLRELDPNAS